MKRFCALIALIAVLLAMSAFAPALAEGVTVEMRPGDTRLMGIEGAAYGSSNPAVASVDAQGLVLARKIGYAIITARTESGAFEFPLRVVASSKAVSYEAVTLDRSVAVLRLKNGAAESLTLQAGGGSAGAKGPAGVIWTSSNPDVATVDQNGLVRAVGEGATVVTASDAAMPGNRTRCKVTVVAQRVSKITLNTKSVVLDQTDSSCDSFQAEATVLPADAVKSAINWKSSDESVATVDQNGLVTARSSGLTTITAYAEGGRVKAQFELRARDKSAMKSFVISGGGDAVLGGDPKRKNSSPERFEKLLGGDYARTFKLLQPVFARDDITILNLECCLKNSSSIREEKQYSFRGKPEYANILKLGSVEAVSIANNHTRDLGASGYRSTTNALKNAGVYYATNKPLQDFNVLTTSSGLRVGVLAYQTPVGSSTLRKGIQAMKAKCDAVVVYFHFVGVPEYTQKVRGFQKSICYKAIKFGASVVMGCHPHLISGIEEYEGKTIFYGLGALVSPGVNFNKHSFVFQQKIYVEPGTGYTESDTPTIYPAFTSSSANYKTDDNNCQPMLLPKGSADYEEVFRQIDKYSAPLANPAKYNKG